MSKDRSFPTGKQKKGKGKRVVTVSQPAAPQPAKPAPKAGLPAKTKQVVPPPVLSKQAAPAAALKRPPQPAAPPAAAAAGVPWSISLEVALYALLAALAFIVRLYALDRFPLQEVEGVRAWAAWGLVRGLPDASLGSQSPLPIFGAALSFLLFGAGDVAARLLPALAGSVCVVLPYALRRELGRTAGLVAAAMLALGPSFLLVSRLVDGGMIVAAGSLVLLACALGYRRSEEDRYVYWAAVALGVMFAADKTAGPTVVILGLLAAIWWLRSQEERTWPLEALRNGGIVCIATAVLLGTGFLSNLQGIQSALVDPLTVWMTQSGAASIAQRAAFYVRVLLAYEPLAVFLSVLAVMALAAAGLRNRRALAAPRGDTDDEDGAAPSSLEDAVASEAGDFTLTPVLAVWSVLSFLFYALLGDQSHASVVQVVLPLSLLAATFVGQRIESGDLSEAGKQMWILAFMLTLIAFSFLPWLNPTSLFGGRFVSLEKRIQNVTAIALAVVILALAGIAAWYAYRLRLKGSLLAAGTALTIALAIFGVHSSWQLNHVNWPNATEPLLTERTSPDVRLLLDDIVAVSRLQGDDSIAITLDDRIRQPVRWYLRRFLGVSTARVGTTTKTPVVIVPAEAKDSLSKSLGNTYVNQRYRLRQTWRPEAPLAAWLRWAHVREQVSQAKGEDLFAFYKLPQ